MKHRTAKIIMGTSIGIAAVAAAIDHTRHPLPEPSKAVQGAEDGQADESPCGLDNPCGLDSGGNTDD